MGRSGLVGPERGDCGERETSCSRHWSSLGCGGAFPMMFPLGFLDSLEEGEVGNIAWRYSLWDLLVV